MKRIVQKGFYFYEDETKWLARGITYGPFRPDDNGHPYPEVGQQREDFAAISDMGCNTLRLYTVPDESLASAAAEYGLRLLVDVPWPKHLDVYGHEKLRTLCFDMTEKGIESVRDWPNVLGVLLGNEIPADLVRWAGARRVEALLRTLYKRAKAVAPDLPVGYSNFPSTEYLPLGFFDFLGFNVYLNDLKAFRQYLTRLRHLYPAVPLILSEVGLDSGDNGEKEQARLLAGSIKAAYEVGMAGAFVFAWTDEWHTGGYDMTEWSFGLVDEDRRPKASLQPVSQVFQKAPHFSTPEILPSVSVVVAAYNGGRTLRKCLESLERLDYPDNEIIVVDDGSTDETQEILKGFPDVRVVTQPNLGLSAARNAGIEAATGDVVAFTDADCCADSDWLYHLAWNMKEGSYDGIGGPNMTPDETGLIRRSIALAPGHATHVLLPDDEVEHIPGCNMAFRREVLIELDGFDPVFRKAGDDVDLVWRLQDAGYRVGFAPAAFVWHHRRATVKSYLKQQAGYGEAEALLLKKHPHRFNDLGLSIWKGTIYGSHESRPLFGGPNVQYGVFCSAGYQCIYEKTGGGFSYLFTSIEWWFLCGCLILVGLLAPPALKIGIIGVGLSVAIGVIRARQRVKDDERIPSTSLPIVGFLWIAQPVVRGGTRYLCRMRASSPTKEQRHVPTKGSHLGKIHFWRTRILEYWGESAPSRLMVLRRLVSKMSELRWMYAPNTEWEPWDLSVVVSWWFKTRITSVEEDHGGGKRLLRFRLQLVPTTLTYTFGMAGIVISGAMALYNTVWARYMLVGLLVVLWVIYRQALHRRVGIEKPLDALVQELEYIPFDSSKRAFRKNTRRLEQVSAER